MPSLRGGAPDCARPCAPSASAAAPIERCPTKRRREIGCGRFMRRKRENEEREHKRRRISIVNPAIKVDGDLWAPSKLARRSRSTSDRLARFARAPFLTAERRAAPRGPYFH